MITSLPEFSLLRRGPLGRAALEHGLATFQEAAALIARLPYGRDSSGGTDRLAILSEARGTCSTKHAFLAALAQEHRRTVPLYAGIFMMTEETTPSVGAVLRLHDLDEIPEAHCFLRYRAADIDLTGLAAGSRPVRFVDVVRLRIGGHREQKRRFHREALRGWARGRGLSLDGAWAIREACIAALTASQEIPRSPSETGQA